MTRRRILGLTCMLGLTLAIAAAGAKAASQGLNESDERWLERDVAAIITADEAATFRELANDADRDLFRQIFWSRRDPDPRTPENEFRSDYEHRVAIADERFRARVGPGSQSEMGQLFLLLGFPLSVDMGRASIRLPEGGGIPESLEASATELTPPGQAGSGGPGSPGAGNSQRIQTWNYPADEAAGFPDGMEVRFRAQPGYGYRLIHSDELDRALAMRRESFITRPELGYTIESGRLVAPAADLVPTDGSLASQILDDLMGGAPPSNDVPFYVTAAFFRSFDEAAYAALLVETDSENPVTVFGSVTPAEGGPSQRFEHRANEIPLQLPPGDYIVHIGVLDEATPAFGTRVTSLRVPSYGDAALQMSSVVLYDSAERSDEPGGTPGQAFQFGSVRLSPRSHRPFTTADTLGLFYYVYFPEGRETELTSRYVFYMDGQERAQTKPKAILTGEGQGLASDEIPLASFGPGDYRVVVQVTDGATGETVEQRVTFTIAP